MTHEEALRSIDHHFAGRLSVPREAAMRAHLPGCAACRARYGRHLALARLDPRVPTARERLARGLGLSAAARPARTAWLVRAGAALAGLAAIALVLHARPRDGAVVDAGGAETGFAARGPATTAGALWIYRVTDGVAPQLAGGSLSSNDELAFAYANPSSKRYLAIFGVDEHGHVYWYYPSWKVGAAPPSAVPASPGAGPHELPEAVRHPLDGRRLDVYALFTDERVGVNDVEHSLARRPAAAGLDAAAVVVHRAFEVRR